jgi:hypothetical protein
MWMAIVSGEIRRDNSIAMAISQPSSGLMGPKSGFNMDNSIVMEINLPSLGPIGPKYGINMD